MSESQPTISRGTVVWAADPFKDPPAARPLIIINNGTHPFDGEQWLAAGVSTTPREPALELTEAEWEQGTLPQRSYAYPWAIISPRIEQIDYVVGAVTHAFVDRIIAALDDYVDRNET